jgi:hypothetical protein
MIYINYAQMIYKMTVYAIYQLYIQFKATLIVTYDLILTLFDNTRICFEILAWTGSYLKGVYIIKYFSL